MSCSNGSVNIFAVSFGDFGKMLQSGRIFNFNKSSARRILPLSVDIEFLNVRSSTDANAPMSMDIPSTCLCSGGHAENAHNVKEFFEMIDTHLGPQLITLAALSLVGVEDEEPLLPKKL